MTLIDPITSEVIRGSLGTIAEEMAITVEHTARSPIWSEGRDLSTAIYDAQGRIAALSSLGIPIHMGSMKYAVQAALEFFGPQDIYDGDIILVNDPYYGGSHIPDWTMVAPTFYRGELVLFPAVKGHMTDSGGPVAGSFNPTAREIWQEGLRIPPLKIYEKGRPRRDILRMLEANNRMPTFMEDIQAMIGGNMIGKRRIGEVLEKYGRETVVAALEYIYDYTERRFRAAIREWHDGTYEADAFLEHDGQGTHGIRVHARVTIEGDGIIVDLSGSDPQVPGSINSSLATVYSWLFLTFCSMIDADIPKNDGLFRPVSLIAPLGTVVNPREPAATVFGIVHIAGEMAEAVTHALAQAVPEKAYSQNMKFGGLITAHGIDHRNGQYFIDPNLDIVGCGCNAAYGVDAWGLRPAAFSSTITTVEMSDLLYPTRIHGFEYTADTGGAGKWRGLCGVWAEKEALAPMEVFFLVIGTRFPLQGLNGGRDGSLAKYVLRYGSPQEKVIEEVAMNEPLEPGHSFYIQFPGGGGWGNPLERDPKLVREDVLDEYVSIDGARRDYGVVIDPETFNIDYEATEALRREMGK